MCVLGADFGVEGVEEEQEELAVKIGLVSVEEEDDVALVVVADFEQHSFFAEVVEVGEPRDLECLFVLVEDRGQVVAQNFIDFFFLFGN